MKRAMQITRLGGEFVRDKGGIEQAQRYVPLPPAPNWFVRGPRGGVYLAVGERERSFGIDSEGFHRDQYVVLDSAEGTRYVRPGTKLHREATDA